MSWVWETSAENPFASIAAGMDDPDPEKILEVYNDRKMKD